MQSRHVSPGRRGRRRRCWPERIRLAGLVMMGVGLLLLFLCIPGWAWLALAGTLLLTAGYLLFTASSG